MKNQKLNPFYIAGLVHADGGFSIKKAKTNKSITLSPQFNLTLEKKHEKLIQDVIKSLGVGNYRIDNKGYCRYSVTSLKEIVNVIIPFFLKYQVKGVKFRSFIIFKITVEKMYRREHWVQYDPLNKTLFYLINLAYHMNAVSNIKIENKNKLLSHLDEEDRNIVLSNKIFYQELIDHDIKKYENFILNIDFIKGLFDGDGSMSLYLTPQLNIRMSFSIVQYKDNLDLLEMVQAFFNGIGRIYLNEGNHINSQAFRLDIKSINDIRDIVIPKFDNFSNNMDNNVKLFKLQLIKDLIDWIRENGIKNIKKEEDFLIYLKYHYLIFRNTNNISFEEHKVNMLTKYGETIIYKR